MSEVEGQPGIDQAESHQEDHKGLALLDGETVLEKRKPHWVNWPKSLIVGGLFALSTLSNAVSGNFDGISTGLIICAIAFGYVYLSRSKSDYVVTDERVLKKVGLIRQTSSETRISDIRGLTTKQGILERFTSTGTVSIDSTAAGGLLTIEGTNNHEALANTIRKQKQRLKA